MANKFNLTAFLKLSPEEQAKSIERETQKVIKRLPTLKKRLKMWGEVSSELYNLTEEELELQGSTWAKAIRGGEVTAPMSRTAYQRFVSNLGRYATTSIEQLAEETATTRFESWKQTILDNASQGEIDYMNKLLEQMTPAMIEGFTRSRYFVDNATWGSEQTFIKHTSEGDMSIQIIELELFLEKNHPEVKTDHLYNNEIATDGKDITRRGILKKKSRKRR